MKSVRKTNPLQRAMTVAGIMSGTSADGIDVALVRIIPGDAGLKLKLLAHHSIDFAKPLRAAILNAMDAKSITTAELARLNWQLGIAYSDALSETLRAYPVKIDLVGCHGQTVYHQGVPAMYAGKKLACTWQLGEMAMLASSAKVPVVSNFRPADMVAGGQGAPLVSLLDYVMFRHAARGRVLQNLGGIANLTAIPPKANLQDLLAFDSGPANMVMDAVMNKLFHRPFDRGGSIGAKGTILHTVLQQALRHPYFRLKPPKSAGREEFGVAFASDFLKLCQRESKDPADAVATATALTARTIGTAYQRFVLPMMKDSRVDYLISGGGAHNPTLVAMLANELAPFGCKVGTTEHAGLPAQAKEATAFALLAYQTWNHLPGNVPAATGAMHPTILGQITYV